jgi:hypothetical protein
MSGGFFAGRQPLLLAALAAAALLAALFGIAHFVRSDLDRQNRVANVSARGPAGTGPEALLVGFVVTDRPQTVVVRGLGPTLGKSGVAGALQELRLRVVRNADGKDLGRNEAWQAPGNERLWGDLRHLAPPDSRDAACVLRLEPGSYSVLVEPLRPARGLAGVELFLVKE